jgi:tRNA U34 2-thiouridine synthase MnmA/TrmU
MATAFALVSGGLDSGLAALTISRQNIKTVCLVFKSLFFDSSAGEKLCQHMKLEYRVVDFTEKHLEIVKNPPSGYGKNMNPCIDCHSLMLQMAGQFLDLEKDDFLVTGEVLDQRPMSQNKDSLNRVDAVIKQGFCAP